MNGRAALERLYLSYLAKRLDEGSIPEPNSGCLLWMRSYATNGYGKISYQGACIRTHRAAWIAAHGSIPAGMAVCHKCDVRECINPDHLFLGTRADNNRDMCAKGRHRYGHHPRGAAPIAKLTPADVLKIRVDHRTHRQIASDFGVSRSTITGIKLGRWWGWVGSEEVAAGA